jgi:hypothetical protein
LCDDHIKTTCPTCGEDQALSDAAYVDGDVESVYTCKKGCQPVLIVGPPGTHPWPGRGYRMGDFTLRNPADLYLWLIDQQGRALPTPLLLEASPAALESENNAPLN